MLRVKADCLKEEVDDELDYIYYYNGELFTGITYDIDEGWDSAENCYYREGKLCSDYINEYFNAPADLKHTLAELLEPDPESYNGEPLTRQSTPFTGIAYSFEEQFCVKEHYYHNGLSLSEADYNKAGELRYLKVNRTDLTYIYEWTEEGSLKKLYIKSDTYIFDLKYDETGRVESLTLDGAYFKKLKELKELIKLPLVEEIAFFKDIRAAETLFLRGELIDDRLFNMLCENHGMDGVKRLEHSDTALSNASLNKFKRLSKRRKNRE